MSIFQAMFTKSDILTAVVQIYWNVGIGFQYSVNARFVSANPNESVTEIRVKQHNYFNQIKRFRIIPLKSCVVTQLSLAEHKLSLNVVHASQM